MKLSKLESWIIQFFLFLIPLFFLPVTRDFFDFNKNILLMVFTLVLVILFAVKSVLEKRVVFKLSILDLPVALFLVSIILSLIFVTSNKIDSMIDPFGAGTFISLILIYFFLKQFSLTKEIIENPLAASASILSVIAILEFTKVMEKLPIGAFYKNVLFSPAGSLLTLASFLVVVLIMIAVNLYQANSKKISFDLKNSLFFTASIITAAGVAVTLILMTSKDYAPLILPYNFGWSISADSLKKPLNAFFGTGLGNFVNVFTQFKPTEINLQSLWSFRFSSSSNFYFQILTELGIFGFASFCFMIIRLIRLKSKLEYRFYIIAILFTVLLIPANLLLLALLFIFLALISKNTSHRSFVYPKQQAADPLVHAFSESQNQNQGENNNYLIIMAFPFVAVCLMAFYFMGQAYRAEILMAKGIVQATRGNAQLTYDYQREAVVLSPYYSPYRLIFAQTNYALATLIAQKQQLSQNDQQTLSQLLTQAINNAKIAINLNPSSLPWQTLAELYKRLLGVTADAANWSATAYNQAITFDPSNPSLRISYGQLYYAVKAYDLAIRQFEVAAALKSDLANSWYNLANAYREKGDVTQSRAMYEKTLTLVKQGTNDYDRVKAEMDALPKEAAEPITQQKLETLSSPASPSAQIKKEVELNKKEVAPNVTLTPSPEASISAQLSPSPTVNP